MRTVLTALTLLIVAACTTTRVVTPREYLDEETAATITVVADPWIFTRERSLSAFDDRDFINLYAIDINRMGDHKQYLAVMQSVPPVAGAGAASHEPLLELRAADRTISLEPTMQTPRELGMAQPLAPLLTTTSQWWYFPVNKEVLSTVAQSRDLGATVVVADKRVSYVIWRDGSAELAELTAVLP